MRITRFRSKFDSTPVAQEVTWSELKDLLGVDRPVSCPTATYYVEASADGSKTKIEIPVDRCPSLTRDPRDGSRLPAKCEAREIEGWSPGLWPDGSTTRKQADVIGADVLVFDIDHTSMDNLSAIDSKIEALGYAAILHSTHSHDPDRQDVCVRLVLPAEHTMSTAEVLATRAFLEAQLGLPTDPSTKDLGRLYFLPSRPMLGSAFLFGAQDGKPVTPTTQAPATSGKSLLSQLSGSVARGSAPNPVAPSGAPVFSYRTNGDMAALKKALSRNPNDWVRRMLAGEAIDEPGRRDDAMQRLAGMLAFKLADASVEAMVELGRRMCAAMDPDKDLDKWRDKLERACERKDVMDAEKQAISDAAQKAFNVDSARAHPDEENPDNVDPFDPARVERWALQHGCRDSVEFQKQWIVRFHGANWIFCNGRYAGGVPDKDLEVSVRRDLARAPVNLLMKNAAGDDVPRPMRAILYEYATAARSVQASFALRESFYDARAQCFHEAVCPVRYELKAKEHPEIHRWLQFFGGETLLDWVACVTRLDKPAAALYIEGPPGTGKNVLADGLARLWHKGGASAFKDVIGSNFNDSLTRCPLIHADEGIPKTDTIIDDLRRLIGSNVCSLNRKFMPVVSLEGSPRLIITANNDRVLLDTGAQLGPSDIDAITQRIRQLKADPAAVSYLAGFRESKGHGYIESWIKDDHVARHALWLSENRKVDETGRFLVAGHDAAQAEMMTTGTGQVGAVMEFLARYLSDAGAMKTPKIRAGGARLLVNTEALADRHAWERYVPSRKIPSARLISDSLRAVSDGLPVTVEGMTYFVVKPHMLINWSRTNQVGSATTIEEKINAQ